jgi:hypothetical protein
MAGTAAFVYFKRTARRYIPEDSALYTGRSFRITGVSDFIHRPDSNNYKKKEQTRRFGN